MANDQGTGLGMYPYKSPFGSIKTGLYRANTSKNIFRYQPVCVDDDGEVRTALNADFTYVLGSVIGWLDVNAAGLPSDCNSLTKGAYLPSGNDAMLIVADDPDQEYVMEVDTGGGTYPTLTSAGSTANFTYEDSTGSTVTGISTCRIDASEIAADTCGGFNVTKTISWN